jgi:hypothetical protein
MVKDPRARSHPDPSVLNQVGDSSPERAWRALQHVTRETPKPFLGRSPSRTPGRDAGKRGRASLVTLLPRRVFSCPSEGRKARKTRP